MVNLARLLRHQDGERVISGRSPDWRSAAMLQAREVVGSVVVASAGANKQGMVGSPCSLIRPARATHRYGT